MPAFTQNEPVGWLLTTLPNDEREYIGNQGYDDIIGESYHYDNKVQNSKRIKVGDVVILRSSRMEGIARITRIHEEQGTKTLLVCPVCHRASRIKSRTTMVPKFRCFKCEATFDEADTKEVDVTKYSAYFDGTFLATPGALSIEVLRGCCVAFNPQLAMQRVDLPHVIEQIRSNHPSAINFLDTVRPTLEVYAELQQVTAELEKEGEFDPDGEDEGRRRILRSIAARAGQSGFRSCLLQEYSGRCAMTGCEVEAVLEAAHIKPYNGPNTNHVTNGILLRADLHTLFDRGLIVIGPDMRIDVHHSLHGSAYEELHGRALRLPNSESSNPSRKALAWHFMHHRYR
jgi:hypothetical protein